MGLRCLSRGLFDGRVDWKRDLQKRAVSGKLAGWKKAIEKKYMYTLLHRSSILRSLHEGN